MRDAHGTTATRRVRPGVRRALLVAALASGVVVAALPAGAEGPETGLDPTVSLTVNPDHGLSDGQTVTVTGAGFPANTSGLIRQCAGSVSLPECDTVVSGFFLTGPNGEISITPMTVQRVITTFNTTYNCAITACALVADAGGRSSRHHVSFAGAGTVPPPTTSPPTTTGGPTTLPPPTTTPPPTTVPPLIGPSTTTPVGENILCVIVRALGKALPGLLGALADALLRLLGCAPLVG